MGRRWRDHRGVVLPLIEPMLASSGSIPGTAEQWAFEPKMDGWRAMVYVSDGALTVRTRTGRDVTGQLPEIAALVEALDHRAVVLDGELVAHQGTPRSFYRLGPRMASRGASASRSVRTPLTFVAFDLLWLDGDWTRVPYHERRAALQSLDLSGSAWCTASSFPGAGAELFAECVRLGLEGLVAKRLTSRYRPGERSRDWVKAKTPSWRAEHAPLRHEH